MKKSKAQLILNQKVKHYFIFYYYYVLNLFISTFDICIY